MKPKNLQLNELSTSVFAREIPLEIRRDDEPQKQGLSETVFVKVYQHHNGLALLLSSEHDLFFHYTSIIDEDAFNEIKEQGQLDSVLQDFPQLLTKLLNSILMDPRQYSLILFASEDGTAQLSFMENFKGYKLIEIMTIKAQLSEEEIIREDITTRYQNIKQKNQELQETLTQLQQKVKENLTSLTNVKK